MAAFFVAVLSVGLGYTLFKVLSGPVAVPYLAQWASDRIQGQTLGVSIGQATLDLLGEQGAELILRDTVVLVHGRTSARAILPETTVGFNAWALFIGQLEVTRVSFSRPSATISLAPGSDPLPRVQNRVVAMDKFSVLAAEELKRWHLQKASIENGRVTLKAQEETFVAEGIDADAEVLDDLSFAVSTRILGQSGEWSWNLKRSITPETGERQLSVDVSDASLRDLMPARSFSNDDKLANTRLFVNAAADLSATGEFVDAKMTLRTTPIFIRTAPDNSVTIDEVHLNLGLERDNPEIQVGRSFIRRQNTRAVFGGGVQPPVTDGEPWTYALGSREVVIAPSDVNYPPLVFPNVQIAGSLEVDNSLFVVNQARAVGLEADINFAGSLYYGKLGPSLALSAFSPSLSFGELLQVWPSITAPKTRNWLLRHLGLGRVDNIFLDVALGPEAFDGNRETPAFSGDDITGSFEVIDGSVKPLLSMPLLRDVSGSGKIENERFEILGNNAHFQMQDGNIVQVPELQFNIKELAKPGDKSAELSMRLTGRMDDIAVLADAEPVNALDAFQLVPADLSGMADVKLEAGFPLSAHLKRSDAEWRAILDLKNFSSKVKISGQTIENADLVVHADKNQTLISGEGKLNGFQSRIELSTTRDGEAKEDRQGVSFIANAKDLKEFGVDLTRYITGAIGVTFEGNNGIQIYELDLKDAEIRLPEVGWRKSSGVWGTARFRLSKTDKVSIVQNFSFLSEGVEVRGNVKLDENGRLLLADFSEFNLRPNDKAKLSVRPMSRGGYKVVLAAAQADGRAFLDGLFANKSGRASQLSSNQRLELDLRFQRLTGFGGLQASNVQINGLIQGNTIADMTVSGATSRNGTFSFVIGGNDAGQFARGHFNNTGEVLRLLDLFPRMRGGRGQLHIRVPEKGNWVGRLTVTDFSITEDPAIKALKDVQPTTSARSKPEDKVFSATVDSGDASFQKMALNFVRRGELVIIENGTLKGAIIGGTFSGTANLAQQALDMSGTFVPVYALNNLFAKIPVVGLILGGGSSDEGLFGVTYRLTGNFNNPKFEVNPVSAIAPGVFRRIFEFK